MKPYREGGEYSKQKNHTIEKKSKKIKTYTPKKLEDECNIE